MEAEILDIIKERIVILDGGMGTELIRHGLEQGGCSESWNEENPDIVKKIHKRYYDAGSDVVLTNSFGGNQIKLNSHGLGERCHELNLASAKIAVKAKPGGKYVAGSMGPTGKFLKPHGEFTEEEFEKAYFIQAQALGEGGVDFLLIETQYDLNESLCALKAAKNSSSIPVFVTMTFMFSPMSSISPLLGSSFQWMENWRFRAHAPDLRKAAMWAASLGPMATSQSEPNSSSRSPLTAATNPGIMTRFLATLSPMPDFLMKIPMASPTNFPAAQAVRTERPSVSITNK